MSTACESSQRRSPRLTTPSSAHLSKAGYTPDKEKICVAPNEFIRSGAFDGVIDFDKVIEDPQNPGHSQMKLNKGDHLHPNPAGYDAMVAAIDLKTLTTSK